MLAHTTHHTNSRPHTVIVEASLAFNAHTLASHERLPTTTKDSRIAFKEQCAASAVSMAAVSKHSTAVEDTQRFERRLHTA